MEGPAGSRARATGLRRRLMARSPPARYRQLAVWTHWAAFVRGNRPEGASFSRSGRTQLAPGRAPCGVCPARASRARAMPPSVPRRMRPNRRRPAAKGDSPCKKPCDASRPRSRGAGPSGLRARKLAELVTLFTIGTQRTLRAQKPAESLTLFTIGTRIPDGRVREGRRQRAELRVSPGRVLPSGGSPRERGARRPPSVSLSSKASRNRGVFAQVTRRACGPAGPVGAGRRRREGKAAAGNVEGRGCEKG